MKEISWIIYLRVKHKFIQVEKKGAKLMNQPKESVRIFLTYFQTLCLSAIYLSSCPPQRNCYSQLSRIMLKANGII
jgi:hypothetical protein